MTIEWTSLGTEASASGWTLRVTEGQDVAMLMAVGPLLAKRQYSAEELEALAELCSEGAKRMRAPSGDEITEDPPVGTVLKDAYGRVWRRDSGSWFLGRANPAEGGWLKTAGLATRFSDLQEYFGPLTLVSRP